MVNGQWQDKCMFDSRLSSYICSIDANYIGRFAICEEACPLAARRLSAKFNKNNQTHPFCLEPKTNVISLIPNDDDIKTIVSLHNTLRSLVGIPYRGSNGTYYTATDLGSVTWDYRLARMAQRYAEYFIPSTHNDFNRLLEQPYISMCFSLDS